jgi:hypothetical protein
MLPAIRCCGEQGGGERWCPLAQPEVAVQCEGASLAPLTGDGEGNLGGGHCDFGGHVAVLGEGRTDGVGHQAPARGEGQGAAGAAVAGRPRGRKPRVGGWVKCQVAA